MSDSIINELDEKIKALNKQINDKNYEIARLQGVIDEIPMDVYWKDSSGFYLGMNSHGMTSLKNMGFISFNDDSIVGKSDRDIFPKDVAEQFFKNDNDIMRSRSVESKEESAKLPSGEKIVQLSVKKPLIDKDGNVTGIIGSTIDITYQKSLEDKLRLANQVKSEFIANMSHDLRTSMTGVQSMVREVGILAEKISFSLKDKSLETSESLDATKEWIKIGKGSTQALLDLFNSILEAAALDSGNVKESPDDFCLLSLIQKNINLLSLVAKYKGVDLKMDISPHIKTSFIGLGHSLDRTLNNLLGNSLKFTEKGFVTLGACLLSGDESKAGETVYVRLWVKDTGIGIPEDKFDEIFGHFSKLNPSHANSVYKGSGLGLYTVKKYVEAMSGTINVESKLGEGAKFIIDLPLVISDKPMTENDSTIEEIESVNSPGPTIQNKQEISRKENSSDESPSVLVVEDNYAAVMCVKSMLGRLSVSSDHAPTGEEAVSMASSGKYSLILMDIGLPGIDGLEAAKRIRELEGSPSKTPVIALTGHVNSEKKCIDSGMQGMIPKPLQEPQLKSLIEKYVIEVSQPVIAWESCVSMIGGTEKEASDMLTVIAKDLITSSQKIKKHYASMDVENLRKELHKVRGGVCYVKLPDLEKRLECFHQLIKEDPIGSSSVEEAYNLLSVATVNFLQECMNRGLIENEQI